MVFALPFKPYWRYGRWTNHLKYIEVSVLTSLSSWIANLPYSSICHLRIWSRRRLNKLLHHSTDDTVLGTITVSFFVSYQFGNVMRSKIYQTLYIFLSIKSAIFGAQLRNDLWQLSMTQSINPRPILQFHSQNVT